MDRRTFLRAGATTGAVGVGAALFGGPARSAQLFSGISGTTWAAFEAGLEGDLVRPGESGYAAAHRLYNPRFDSILPTAVVRAEALSDVVETVKFARAHDLTLRPRSGGHSYVGASTGKGVVQLDLSRLRRVRYDAGLVTVQAGAKLFDVHDVLDGHGRTIPTGTCATVGVSGLTLGGGVGVESRLMGLTCDVLHEAVVVTADGAVHNTSATREPNLFWALRGGGGGNFGVVTRYTFRTFAASSAGFFFLHFRAADAEQVVRGWLARLPQMPRTSWANVHLDAVSGGLDVRIVGLSTTGDGHAEAALLEAAIARPVTQATFFTRSHHDAVRLLAGCSTKSDQECHLVPSGELPRESFAAGSDVVAGGVRQLDAAVRWVRRRGLAGGKGSLILDPLGGAVGDVATGSSAFPWRRAKGIAQWYVPLSTTASSSTVDAAYTWVRGGHQAFGSASAGGYVNYLEPGRALRTYYGSNFDRLRRVKAAVDPTNFFHSKYTVPRP